jgi:hypothetical protein
MAKKLLITVCVFIVTFGSAKSDRIIVHDQTVARPILDLEVVEIPSKGKVYLVEGA